jgi:hypothetical protein
VKLEVEDEEAVDESDFVAEARDEEEVSDVTGRTNESVFNEMLVGPHETLLTGTSWT